MKKYLYILAAIGCISLAAPANAQLPANPWAPNPNDGYFGEYAGWPAVLQSAAENVPHVTQKRRYPHAQ